ncbi:YbhB/YbcL family Raf kinase inhibitor-like protein [Duganella sp. FT50W]|uniref:YbhB/YbcL family Raf kinase inhibitor-like protein n=1 Tax=Duganella lactea TaxID=2692173 RepID=A0A6L8MKT0_9BURK|nr:YbhB/YbcL family Raf kinase inhibitor-like protein [Duganella lactea]MYM34226.1 YbhB/YbcL family Raf kinase inhibitor-like protein [Duganella lactea]MYM83810.1 YbhB/YbcL family Raf kinase inhibitor-like protein [Duganella lactea]
MKLASDSFRNRAAMPAALAGRHPQLRWTDVPAGAASLVMLCLQGDVPDGDCFHWSVVDMPPSLMALAAGALPAEADTVLHGVPLRQGLNDFGAYGYHAPVPAQGGLRHYIFRIYALDVARLELPAGFGGADVLNAIYGHIIDEAQLIGAGAIE